MKQSANTVTISSLFYLLISLLYFVISLITKRRMEKLSLTVYYFFYNQCFHCTLTYFLYLMYQIQSKVKGQKVFHSKRENFFSMLLIFLFLIY